MNLPEHYDRAVEDLRYDELMRFNAHLLGGLIQALEDGTATKTRAAAARSTGRVPSPSGIG